MNGYVHPDPTQLRPDALLLLALCPLLAMSDTVANAVGLGVALVIIVPMALASSALIGRWLTDELRLAASVLLFAGITAGVELLLSAWFHELRDSLGILLPLIVANAAFIALAQRTDAAWFAAAANGLKLVAGIALGLLILAFARELVGRGSLLHGAGLLLGAWATPLEARVFRVDMGFLLALLPPGAFIAAGLLLAARNWIAQRRA